MFEVIENFNMIQYTTVDISDEESLSNVLLLVDNLVQYDEYKIPKDSHFLDNQDEQY